MTTVYFNYPELSYRYFLKDSAFSTYWELSTI
nr:MAG TPA: hypothetical protein [Caudoviricetes sp.]